MSGTKHFSRMNYHVKRGMRELLSHRTLSDAEWMEIRSFFDNVCAYCGCEDTGNPRTGIVPDHLIPSADHGETCMGNIVPSCQDCNDRRGKKDWRQFLETEFTEDSLARIQTIQLYIKQYPYKVPDSPHEFLNSDEASEYLSIIQSWEETWERARRLRDKIVKRRRYAES